jgi:hypothetical protein
MKQFSQVELNQIFISEGRAKEAAFELEILKLRQQVLQQKAKNFELIVSLKAYEIAEAAEKLQSLRRQHTSFMNDLKAQHEISSERWGYDPDSGEIKED